MTLRIALCDDENDWINHFEEYFIKFKMTHKDVDWDIFYSAEDFLKYCNDNGSQYDVLITDIEMGSIIHIVVGYKDCRLIICIQNSADNSGIMKADKGIGFISSKSKDDKHGIGINNIYNIVRKYDGMCKFMPEKTTFTVYILLFDI